MGDETWAYGYDVETKSQSSQWVSKSSPRRKKARHVRSNVKVTLIDFFDCEGVVYHTFVPRGLAVNKEYYLEVVKSLREAVRKKRSDSWWGKKWMLHHDNAPAHASSLIREFLAKNEITVVPQPPYSPDLLPADFFLFPKLKFSLKGQRFESTEEIEENSLTELLAIPKKIITGLFPKLEKTLGGFY
jgi:transposase